MLSRSEEKLVRGLAQRRRRVDDRLFLAEGVRVAEELFDAGIVPRLAVTSPSLEDTDRGRRLADRLPGKAPVRAVSDGELARLAPTRTPQGVLVVAEVPRAEPPALPPTGPGTALVLDGVQDPGNLGTLARTAAAFGCHALACLPGTVDPWSPKSVRAAAGALFRIPVLQTTEEAVWQWLLANRFVVLGADAGGTPVREVDLPDRVALLVGNEGAGLSASGRGRCRQMIAVPMRAAADSLNVAVAAAILLYELTRERE